MGKGLLSSLLRLFSPLLLGAFAFAGCRQAGPGGAANGKPCQPETPSFGNCRNEITIGKTVLGPVNRKVLGNNIIGYQKSSPDYSMKGSGVWDSDKDAPVEAMVKLAKEAGISVLRWPGGCGTHTFNWKLAVGPRKSRPAQAFGLPEFLRFCEAMNAEPVITLADYWGRPEDFADIVEYLNSPVGANPNGGEDWAKMRAADGHPQPYGVACFECGNESMHGLSCRKDPTPGYHPKDYSKRYLDVQAAMKAVDPGIKLGAVLAGDADRPFKDFSQWNQAVVRETGPKADFYIEHSYLPVYSSNAGAPSAAELFASAFAAPRQFDDYYGRLNEFILKEAGRPIPIAITEYNGCFVQESPVPYRLCLGTAVEVAALLQVFLNPKNNIANAEYWQFSNEYWGMVKGYQEPYLLRPAYYAFKLCNDYLGETLLETEVVCGGYDSSGVCGVMSAKGDRIADPQPLGPAIPLPGGWKIRKAEGASACVEGDGSLCVEIAGGADLNYFHSTIQVPAKFMSAYRVTAEMRVETAGRKGARLEIVDGRGWSPERPAASSIDILSSEWTPVKAEYATLPDAKSLEIRARRTGNDKAPGEAVKFWIRNLSVQEIQRPGLGRTPYLSAVATKKADGAVSLVIVNRHLNDYVPVRIKGTGAVKASAESLSGPSIDSTNEKDPMACAVRPLAAALSEGAVCLELPPHSVTGVLLEGGE